MNFEVHGLWVHRSALGMTFVVSRPLAQVSVTLPAHADDLRTHEPVSGVWYRALSGGSGTVDDPDQARGVLVIRTTVEFEADITPALIEAGGVEFDEASRVLTEMARESQEAVQDVMSFARAAYGQSWLGLSTEPVSREGVALVLDVESGERLKTGPPYDLGGVQLHSVSEALTPDDFARIAAEIGAGTTAPIPETFLADAQYLAWGAGTSSDAVRAVLTAAIACETKAKVTLRAGVTTEQRPLLDFILDSRRVPAASGLFDTVPKTAIGRSLREEDQELFQQIDRLFRVRNRVVHTGEWPSVGEGQELVRAATQAFSWLDSLSPGSPP